ncbi:MAG: tail fiber protein [Bacteroidetes bacterium]|nr:tail fiber protein [Bacteroidota bacterium]
MPGGEPFLGELALFPYNFAPRGFAYCEGQLQSIAENTALFSLLGTSFGGNGQTTFALPDLRGRMIRGVGQGPGMNSVDLGETAGQESVTLLATEMPTHTHTAVPVATGRRTRTPSATSGASAVLDVPAYGTAPDGAQGLTGLGGSGVPVNNLPPYLVLSPCIALVGIFPSRP